MHTIDSDFILKTLPDGQLHNNPFPSHNLFVVDSRSVQKGDIFVALIGAKVDGHQFIGDALRAGAVGFIIELSQKDALLEKHGSALANSSILFVSNTLTALTKLAYAWRSQFSYPIVAVTGTVGKTTTKEMIGNILSAASKKYIVSLGNQNTIVGISLNILRLRPDHSVGVFEVGIASRGSMKKLVELLRPTISAITAIGHGHMEGLGDISSVASEKRDVFSYFKEGDIGIINGDQPELATVSYNHPVIRFGKKVTNQVQARKIVCQNNNIECVISIYHNKYMVTIPSCNQSRIINGLAAISVGYLLKIADEFLIAGIQKPLEVPGRFQELHHRSGSIIINDSYNCNPESAKASLLAFNDYKTDKKKVVVLGDMLELGQTSQFWHRQIGRMVHKVDGLEQVILIGTHIQVAKKTLPVGVKLATFASATEAFELLKDMILQQDKIFLCKASNSMKFVELIASLQEV